MRSADARYPVCRLAFALLLLTACARAPEPEATPTATPTFEQSVRRSIVRIENREPCNVGVGTGWVLDDVHLVTNSHMIEGDGQVDVEFWHGATLKGTVEKASPARDLAIVKVPAGLPAPLPVFDDEVTTDMPLRIAGFPLAEDFSISRGRLIREEAFLGFTTYLLDATIQSGDSGGPVLTENGEVAAIITAKKLQEVDALAIPVADVARLQRGEIQSQERVGCGAGQELLLNDGG